MLPKIWGPYGWNFLHLVTIAYPENPTEDDKMKYYNYFYCLQYVLPCAKCQYNMSQHLKKYPLNDEVLSSRTNLVKWGIDLHNIVNYYTGKPMLTYAEAMNDINKLMDPVKSNNNWFIYILLIIVIVIVIYLIYYYRFKKN